MWRAPAPRSPLSAAWPSCPSVFPNRISVSGDSITPRANARNITVCIRRVSPPDPSAYFLPAQGLLATHGLAAVAAQGLLALVEKNDIMSVLFRTIPHEIFSLSSVPLSTSPWCALFGGNACTGCTIPLSERKQRE